MRVRAKIIKYYCEKDNTECFDNCNLEECCFCEKEYIFIDKDYKNCTFYEDMFGRYYLEIGSKKYIYDEAVYILGAFIDTIFEYIIIDNEIVFGEYKKDKEMLEDE